MRSGPHTANENKRHRWMRDIEERQRNIVFPDTLHNQTRFWRNIGNTPPKLSTKIGLGLLAIWVLSWGSWELVVGFRGSKFWWFVLLTVLLAGSLFGGIAWATRKGLRNIESERSNSILRKR